MSQPFDRLAICPPPIQPDARLKAWWVENPWMIASKGKSLSGYERNRVYVNAGGREFFEVSGLTGGADSDGDGRSVVASDLDGDGLEDLLVRQAGGGSLLYFANRLPRTRWLTVTLRGVQSNTRGIGARLVATVGERTLVRENFPPNGFKCQGPAHVHFGLGGEAEAAPVGKVDKLVITWPSGLRQELVDVPVDRHIVVTEGEAILGSFDAAK